MQRLVLLVLPELVGYVKLSILYRNPEEWEWFRAKVLCTDERQTSNWFFNSSSFRFKACRSFSFFNLSTSFFFSCNCFSNDGIRRRISLTSDVTKSDWYWFDADDDSSISSSSLSNLKCFRCQFRSSHQPRTPTFLFEFHWFHPGFCVEWCE